MTDLTPFERSIYIDLIKKGRLDWSKVGTTEVAALNRLVKKGYAKKEGLAWYPVPQKTE